MAPGMLGTFPRRRGLTIPTCIRARAWRTYRDTCRDRLLTVFFEVGGGENVPGIMGACATRNFTYLVRDPWNTMQNKVGFCFIAYPETEYVAFMPLYHCDTRYGWMDHQSDLFSRLMFRGAYVIIEVVKRHVSSISYSFMHTHATPHIRW